MLFFTKERTGVRQKTTLSKREDRESDMKPFCPRGGTEEMAAVRRAAAILCTFFEFAPQDGGQLPHEKRAKDDFYRVAR